MNDTKVVPVDERRIICDALLSYHQADADGVMVVVSRQAIHEAVGLITALAASPAPQERRVGQRRTNLGWASNSDITLKRIKHAQDRRVVAPIAAGQEMTGEGPKKGDTVAPVPAAPDYSSVPMGPVGATYPAAPEPTDHLDAPGPVCDHDSKPCPPPKAGRGPGASQCELDFGNSLTLQFELFELMVPSKESKLPLSAEECNQVIIEAQSNGLDITIRELFLDVGEQALAAIELEKQAEYERQWKEQYYTQSMRQVDKLFEVRRENAALCHDIVRHVQIAADQANEIAELNRIVTMLNDELKRRLG